MSNDAGHIAEQPSMGRIIPDPGPETRPAMVVVTCAGRSGSKWMLRLLDFHPETLCRNEPARMHPWLVDRAVGDWDAWYGRAMDVGPRIGFVDRAPADSKAHLRAWARFTRADLPLYSKMFQKLLGRTPEARYPRMIFHPGRVARAQRVLKLINARYFICRMLEETDHIPVIHIVRHPGGMLNSWLNRFAPTNDRDALFETQQGILQKIHERDPGYAEVTGPIEGMEMGEMKLWCWRHAQDHMLRLGDTHPRYVPVVFERLSRDPLGVMAPVYALCGLEFTDRMRTLIERETADSEGIADAWKRKLSGDHVALIERVLDGSRVGGLLAARA